MMEGCENSPESRFNNQRFFLKKQQSIGRMKRWNAVSELSFVQAVQNKIIFGAMVFQWFQRAHQMSDV